MRIRYIGIAVVSRNSNRFTYISLVPKFSTYIYVVILYSVVAIRQMWIKTELQRINKLGGNIYWFKKKVKVNLRAFKCILKVTF